MSWGKFCARPRKADALAAVSAGADALGLVREPGSKRWVDSSDPLFSWEAPIPKVEVFLEYSGEAVGAGHWIQSENAPPEDRDWLCVVRFRPGTDVARALGQVEHALGQRETAPRSLLIDTFDPNQGGGTGRTSDWELARELVGALPLPVVLAGGLRAENVEVAIQTVRPWGVDVSSGVEAASGIKDPHRILEFITRARRAFDQLEPENKKVWGR